MRVSAAACAVLVLAGCSDLASSNDTVVALQVTAPPGGVVEVGDTVTYTAVALNRNGDVISTPIVWSTPDTANIAIDSATGVVLGKKGPQARVVATSEGLVAPLNVVTVVATPDTLILVPPDTIVVDTLLATNTPPLVARLETFNPVGPIAGRFIIYEVIEPVFVDSASWSVKFASGGQADTAQTGANGEPVTAVTLARIPGVTPPDSAIVEIRATRYKSQQPVPGSGQRWIIRFGI